MQINFNPGTLEEATTMFNALTHWILVQERINQELKPTQEERLAACQEIANAEALIERAVTK